MPCSTPETFDAAALILSLIWSSPFTTYLSWHGVPALTGLAQFLMMSVKPMSLPPMVRLTARVLESSASNCGAGFGGGLTLCEAVMSLVSAPLQLTSRNVVTFRLG